MGAARTPPDSGPPARSALDAVVLADVIQAVVIGGGASATIWQGNSRQLNTRSHQYRAR
jgi:hypothetical protein